MQDRKRWLDQRIEKLFADESERDAKERIRLAQDLLDEYLMQAGAQPSKAVLTQLGDWILEATPNVEEKGGEEQDGDSEN